MWLAPDDEAVKGWLREVHAIARVVVVIQAQPELDEDLRLIIPALEDRRRLLTFALRDIDPAVLAQCELELQRAAAPAAWPIAAVRGIH